MTAIGLRLASLVPSATLRGLLLALAAGLIFQVMNAVVRHTASELPPLMVAWGRWTFGFLVIAPFLLRSGLAAVRTRQLPLHAARAVFHAFGYGLWYIAIIQIPLAEASALGFTGPIFVALGAALFLGERLRLRRVVAIGIGFVGVMVILRPGIAEVSDGSLLMLATVPLIAASNLIAKVVAGRDRPEVVVFWQSLLAMLLFAPVGLWFWQTPTPGQLGWLLLAASLGTAAYLLTTEAMRLAEISAIQPMNYLGIVWAGLFDWIVFANSADIWTFIGAGIVIASTTFIAHREAKLSREAGRAAGPVR